MSIDSRLDGLSNRLDQALTRLTELEALVANTAAEPDFGRNLRLEALIQAINHRTENASHEDIVKAAGAFTDFLEGRTITPGERAINQLYVPKFDRQSALEDVMAEIARATDSKGRPIVLVREMTGVPSALRKAMNQQMGAWTPDTAFIGGFGDPPEKANTGERTFWHNVGLLARALELAV